MATEEAASASQMVQAWVVLGFFDGSDVGDLCFLDSCEAQGLSIKGNMGADGSGFFIGLCCLRCIPTKFHTQFGDGSAPMGIYG